MKQIILASGSPRRKELMERLNLKFNVEISNIDENAYAIEKPDKYVKTLAVEKARDIAQNTIKDALIIGCDTVVVLDGNILGKPSDENQAYDYLKALSGRTHCVYSGIAMLNTVDDEQYVAYEMTEVIMKELSDNEIVNYIKTGEPVDKAGAYGIQGIGAMFIEGIRGDYYNVMGLPLNQLYMGFHALGIDYFEIVSFSGINKY